MVLRVDTERVRWWKQRVLELFLHYEQAIQGILTHNPAFLKDELEKWNGRESCKRPYFRFLWRELRKFQEEAEGEYLNLNFNPSNYQTLIFLPWNCRINGEGYPVFIEYKKVQDKLKLKVYVDLVVEESVTVEELFIGQHNYTQYIRPRHVFGLDEQPKNSLTLEEIRKQHLAQGR